MVFVHEELLDYHSRSLRFGGVSSGGSLYWNIRRMDVLPNPVDVDWRPFSAGVPVCLYWNARILGATIYHMESQC